MFEPAKISDAFLSESRLDLLSANLLFEKGIYSRAVYFAQQSAEKAIKACLALRNIISGEHKVTAFFEEEFRNDFDSEVFAEILRNARELEVQGLKTRYPLFSRPDMPMWIPSQEYTEEDASEAIRKSSFILDSLEKFIKSSTNPAFLSAAISSFPEITGSLGMGYFNCGPEWLGYLTR